MKALYAISANLLFILHIALGLVFLFGWLYPEYKLWYLLLLACWPLSWIMLGYCPITKWEMWFRRKYDQTIDTNREFIHYYFEHFFGITIQLRRIYATGLLAFIVLVTLSLSQ